MSGVNQIIPLKDILNRIFTIRGVQVMIDRDLAEIFGVKLIRLREQVKRNINRFPEDLMFRLTMYEVNYMVSRNAIPSKTTLRRTLALCFYRTRRSHAFGCASQRDSGKSKHSNYSGFCGNEKIEAGC